MCYTLNLCNLITVSNVNKMTLLMLLMQLLMLKHINKKATKKTCFAHQYAL